MVNHHKAGTLRILAISGDARDSKLPDVPAFKELGFDITVGTSRAMVVAKKTSPDRIAVLEKAFLAAVNDPKLPERATALSFGISPAGQAGATERVRDLDSKFYPILLEADMVKVRKKIDIGLWRSSRLRFRQATAFLFLNSAAIKKSRDHTYEPSRSI
jgi:tripartite-type tricarboxylate transporter receptor subunit TctC